MSHVAELPGCFAVGSDAPSALAATPAAITRLLAWLRAHREPLVPEAHVSRPSVADLFVADVRREGAPLVGGSRAELFDFDKDAWDDEKLERTLRWLGYSRADLLAAVEGMDEDAMNARQIAEGRSLRDTLRHVSNAEYGYINRVAGPLDSREQVTDSYPPDTRERLAAIRDIFLRNAREVSPGRRGEVIYPTWAARPNEPWTLQKAVRRALEHELEHLAEINKG